MINDSDIGYTFWDEMWNTSEDEKGKQRRETSRTNDPSKDDPTGPRG